MARREAELQVMEPRRRSSSSRALRVSIMLSIPVVELVPQMDRLCQWVAIPSTGMGIMEDHHRRVDMADLGVSLMVDNNREVEDGESIRGST